MRTVFQILILVLILNSCKDEIKENKITNTESKKANQIQRDTFSFDGTYEINPNANLKSELKYLLLKLRELENNYQTIKIGKSKIEESIVCQGIERLSKLNFEREYFDVRNMDKFKEGIIEINYAYIKGTKELGEKLFPRAKVEELIFKSEESASKLTKFVNGIKEKGYIWGDVDKSPNSIYNHKNKVYYISSGGWYMKPFYKEIENRMKK